MCSLAIRAEEFTVFEKDGYFGIKDETGNVTVPAVYEKLGWSNGTSDVKNGVIGFKRDNLWGLITVRNKALTGQKFYTIEPLSDGHFKASIKGRFSNYLFHGILDEKGNTVISFNYFTIEPLGANWLVSDFDGKKQQFGVVSFENRLIIPTNYASVFEENGLLLSKQIGQKIDVYRSNGDLLQLDLDSIKFQNGWVVFRDGYAGFLSENGSAKYPFEYKNFSINGGDTKPVPFPDWNIYKSDSLLLTWNCDSLSVSKNRMLVAYLNGAHHLLLDNNVLLDNHELILKEVAGNRLIVQNSKTRKWAVINDQGKSIFSGYDSIHAMGNYYGGLNQKGWFLIDKKGKLKNKLPLQSLKRGLNGQFIAMRNGHWGILKDGENESITYKYDSIVASERAYRVAYLNRWGLMNKDEEWIIRSEYNEVFPIGELLVGRRGDGYTLFYDGRELYKTTSRPTLEIGNHILIESDSGKVGLIDRYGELVISPQYDRIRLWSNYYELTKDDRITLRNELGGIILKLTEGYQEVSGYGDEYFVIKKENRWGFVDRQGRLRISNRYDLARPFNENLAPIKLREKWGFIDKSEEIRIQPYYDDVTPFQHGRSIVSLDNQYGLVNESGDEVLELIWESIRRLSTGNYLVRDKSGRFGLVDANGSFIFRPSFDQIKDFGDRVLVSKNGVSGILDYSGHPIFKLNKEEIKVIGDLTMIKN